MVGCSLKIFEEDLIVRGLASRRGVMRTLGESAIVNVSFKRKGFSVGEYARKSEGWEGR